MNTDALFNLTHGMYVIGSKGEQWFAGCTVDAIMQVASKPLILAFSGQNSSFTRECIAKNGIFSISVLGKGVDPFIVANFGFQSSRNIDKWSKVKYHLQDGLPYLDNCIAQICCKVIKSEPFESNTLFTVEVVDCENVKQEEPLTYLDYRTSFKAEVLKFLPNILKNKENKMAEKQLVCTVCAYVYDGDVPFDQLPDDYMCPICGVGKEFFEEQ